MNHSSASPFLFPPSDHLIKFKKLLHILGNKPGQLLILRLNHQRHRLSHLNHLELQQRNLLPLLVLDLAIQVQLDRVIVLGRGHHTDVPYLEQLLQVLLVD